MPYRIHLEKENFKFSVSHFTIFGSGAAERLHGHNYYVSVDLRLKEISPDLGMAFDFNLVKPCVREITDALDEFVLLPAKSPHLKVETSGNSVRALFSQKEYLFPSEDVRVLPVTNVTSEELARFIATELAERLKKNSTFATLEFLSVGVQETRGQGVFFEVEL